MAQSRIRALESFRLVSTQTDKMYNNTKFGMSGLKIVVILLHEYVKAFLKGPMYWKCIPVYIFHNNKK